MKPARCGVGESARDVEGAHATGGMQAPWGVLSVLSLLLLLTPVTGGGQGVLERTPNLSGGWVAETGAVHFNFLHRFWAVDANEEDKVVNSPTFLLAAPLPGRTLVGAHYATNSLVSPGRFNEWELFGRWAPDIPSGPFEPSFTVAYNTAAESADAELGLGLPAGPLRIMAAGRAFSDMAASGDPGWGAAAGAVYRIRNGLALAADVSTVWSDGERSDPAWGAALQFRIPATPHTVSLQATNTRTGTLQGSSVPDRSRGGTVWGFEFTIPFTLARYLPIGGRGGGGGAAESDSPQPAPDAAGGTVEVTMTNDLRFLPDTLEIQVGDTVVWRNTTPLIHTVTADPEVVPDPDQVELPEGAETFDSGDMEEGEEFRWVFTVPGTYRYVCIPHAPVNMVGRIVVRER